MNLQLMSFQIVWQKIGMGQGFFFWFFKSLLYHDKLPEVISTSGSFCSLPVFLNS